MRNIWQDGKLDADFHVGYTIGIGPTLLWKK